MSSTGRNLWVAMPLVLVLSEAASAQNPPARTRQEMEVRRLEADLNRLQEQLSQLESRVQRERTERGGTRGPVVGSAVTTRGLGGGFGQGAFGAVSQGFGPGGPWRGRFAPSAFGPGGFGRPGPALGAWGMGRSKSGPRFGTPNRFDNLRSGRWAARSRGPENRWLRLPRSRFVHRHARRGDEMGFWRFHAPYRRFGQHGLPFPPRGPAGFGRTQPGPEIGRPFGPFPPESPRDRFEQRAFPPIGGPGRESLRPERRPAPPFGGGFRGIGGSRPPL